MRFDLDRLILIVLQAAAVREPADVASRPWSSDAAHPRGRRAGGQRG